MRRDSNDLQIPFGLREDRLLRPDEVVSGLACSCICPECKSPLQARHRTNPNHRSYFAHHRAVDCPGGYETAVHSMAIQILFDSGCVTIPEKKIRLRSHLPNEADLIEDFVFPSRCVVFQDCVYETRVREEESLRRWRPDLTATLKNDAILYVEVAVTHESEIEKTRDLDNLMEIDLSRLPRAIVDDAEKFERQVLELAPRKWFRCSLYDDLPIVHKKLEALKTRHEYERQARQEVQARFDREKARKTEARSQHASKIAALHAVMENTGYAERMNYLSGLSEAGIAYAKQQLAGECGSGEALPAAVNRSVSGDWLFNGHPIAWQGFIFDNYIYRKSPGKLLRTDSIADAVVREFGLASWAEELLSYSKTKRFNPPAIWFLDDSENRHLLKPELVVGFYLQSLSRPPFSYLKTRFKHQQYFIRFSSIEQKKASEEKARKAEKAKLQAAQEQANIEAARRERNEMLKEQASLKKWLPEHERLERNIKRLAEMWYQGHKKAYLCGYCHCPFIEHSCICPECGVGEPRKIGLSDHYVASFPHRLQSMPRTRVKKDYRDE
ncbi:hypothetical protein HLV39_15380 [Marinobacter adhaerens]|uniref:Competence protein CoiA-like family protein n=1 Tax=Marinobacter adhaerens TaxID=1033846 RepID=A0A851HU37_9GAMM|nr:hypothetical protein [Marinobacter adhaerens]